MVTCVESTPASSKKVNGELKSRATMGFMGLSSDTKPTTSYEGVLIANGSTFFAMNTSTVYMYDEDNTTWHELG